MRKTLAVLAFVMVSLLVLQSPAWAPNIYRLKRTDGDRGTRSTWTAFINCSPGSTATIRSASFSTVTTTVEPSSDPSYEGQVAFYTVMRPGFASQRTATTTVTCTLPDTGGHVLRQLLLGIGLLMLGGLFMMLTMHPSTFVRIRGSDSSPPG